MCFARPGRRAQRLHQKRRRRDVAHRARLIRPQSRNVVAAHIQPCAVIGRINQAEDAGLFGHDHIQRVFLVTLALVCAPWCADAHPHRVDDLLDQFPRLTSDIDGQLSADQLHHVRASEGRLVDVCGHLGHTCALQRAPRCALPLGARAVMRAAVQHETARIGAPLLLERLPGQCFRFGRPGGLLRGRGLRGAEFAVDHHQVAVRPLP